ncbi:hypothetical protein FNV43_RR02390 [Rhamnella rubrinervis]|uniref:Uncharacterized protein n=1 Tax=Rhamnella rubrinervis TaxID=2594499 RepID=A0A8K0MT70_9ROSA|nr:hypothetical protein FNV43_RR02390 [Rhamnella rubrinervis]
MFKELKADAIESEEVNRKQIKKLEDTVVQLEEKSGKATQELKSLKYEVDTAGFDVDILKREILVAHRVLVQETL